MQGLLAGRLAVITGASRGIGQAVAEAFAVEKAHVILTAEEGQEEGLQKVRLSPNAYHTLMCSSHVSTCYAVHAVAPITILYKDLLRNLGLTCNHGYRLTDLPFHRTPGKTALDGSMLVSIKAAFFTSSALTRNRTDACLEDLPHPLANA